jgi:hypothetical protein
MKSRLSKAVPGGPGLKNEQGKTRITIKSHRNSGTKQGMGYGTIDFG